MAEAGTSMWAASVLASRDDLDRAVGFAEVVEDPDRVDERVCPVLPSKNRTGLHGPDRRPSALVQASGRDSQSKR